MRSAEDKTIAEIEFEIKDFSNAQLVLQSAQLYDNRGIPLRTRLVDEGVKTLSVPTITGLGQNYPNPFNPETWIPYQLAESSEVTIRIYNISGQLVRTLHLGRQNAGIYWSRGKAAYWDGKNNAGVQIASGVYFYHLQAGSFNATKKLVVLK